MAASPRAPAVYAGKFLRVRKTGHWEYVERTKASGVVVILALTTAKEVVLAEQLRPAVAGRVVSLPAGLAGDEPGRAQERLLDAAKRELKEETGYTGGRWTLLGAGPSSPGLTNEMITFYLARGVRLIQVVDEKSGEKIAVHTIPLARLPSFLRRRKREGGLIDYKIFAALQMAGVG